MAEEVPDIDKPRVFEQYEHAGNQPDVYVKCPYFPEHELRRSRLPYHLIKCQENPRAPKLLVCPYNYLHRVKPEDRHEHALLCEDRVFHKYSDRQPASVGKTRAQLGHNPGIRAQESSTSSTNEEENW